MTISSSGNPLIKKIRSLSAKKYRSELGLFIAEGPLFLERAHREGWAAEHILTVDGKTPFTQPQPETVTANAMQSISGQNNPLGMLAVFRQRYLSEMPSPKPEDVWLALDTIRDPGNLGTIIRTVDAVGATGLLLVGPCCDPYSPESVKASMGSIFAVPLLQLETGAFISLCRAWKGEAAATAAGATADFRRSYRRPLLLVMGSEGRGLAPEIARACSLEVAIPIAGGAESLNVGVAAGILLYEACREARRKGTPPPGQEA